MNSVPEYIMPELKHINDRLNGAFTLQILPTTVSTPHGAAATRKVVLNIINSGGEIIPTISKTFVGAASVAKSSAGGTVSIPSADLVFVNGTCTVTITEAGAWLAADTNTLTIATIADCDNNIAGGTSVETMS